MKVTAIMLTVSTVILPATNLAVAAGNGDVTIRLNGGFNKAIIGFTNILEVYVTNDAPISAMSLGFEITSTQPYNWVKGYGAFPPALAIVMEHGDAIGSFLGGFSVTDFIDILPSKDSFQLVGTGPLTPLPLHGAPTLCYTLRFTIPFNATPTVNGFSVDNINFAGGTWTFTDTGPSYAPKFNGLDNANQLIPDAAPVYFDIVNAPFNGDINCNGTITSADIIALVNYVFKGGPAPCP